MACSFHLPPLPAHPINLTTHSSHEGAPNSPYIQPIRLLILILQVLAILYKGGNAAKSEPRLLGTIENEVSDNRKHFAANPC